MSAPLLRAEAISFSYGARHVFTMWSADLHPGLTWLRGANGSGKSTLLKLLAGALDPFTGRRVAAPAPVVLEPGVDVLQRRPQLQHTAQLRNYNIFYFFKKR